jgi:hypothetical protein
MDHQTIIQIAVTVIAIPVTLFFFQRFVNKADAAQAKEEDHWRGYVREEFLKLGSKLTRVCDDNRRDHEELYTAKNDITTRVSRIEEVHHQRGCDQPYTRRDQDERITR